MVLIHEERVCVCRMVLEMIREKERRSEMNVLYTNERERNWFERGGCSLPCNDIFIIATLKVAGQAERC